MTSRAPHEFHEFLLELFVAGLAETGVLELPHFVHLHFEFLRQALEALFSPHPLRIQRLRKLVQVIRNTRRAQRRVGCLPGEGLLRHAVVCGSCGGCEFFGGLAAEGNGAKCLLLGETHCCGVEFEIGRASAHRMTRLIAIHFRNIILIVKD